MIFGVSPRDLDRYTLRVITAGGTLTAPPDGSPVPVTGAVKVVLDRWGVIRGQAATAPPVRG